MTHARSVRRPLPVPALLLALTALGPLAAAPARAQQFQIKAEGTLCQVQNPDHVFDSTINVSTPFTWTETFDFSTPNSTPGQADYATYSVPATPTSVVITVGDETFSPSEGSGVGVTVARDTAHPDPAHRDQFQMTHFAGAMAVSRSGVPVADGLRYRVELSLYFRPPSSLTSLALPPLAAYDLSKIDQGAMVAPLSVWVYDPKIPNKYQDYIMGRLLSLTVTVVPTPTDAAAAAPPASPPAAPAPDTADVRRQLAAKDAVIAALHAQIAALQTTLRKLTPGSQR